jgi:alkylglycerol monooxygenase
MNLTALIVPAFFAFLFIEYTVMKRKGITSGISFENSISNISIGIAERLLNLLITGTFYGLYKYVYNHYAMIEIPSNAITFVLLLLATDFVWYWYHRLGHEINLMWGAHVVHHQSEEFNYTVSARITTLQAIIRNLFWCVLPFIGFEPSMVIVILVVHGAYSFFTHTETIGKLGWAEKIFITPSHHRVHHASNEKYLNKNYGDIFIFWDKMFGTFQKEEEKPLYGLTHPLKSHSFLWQHFHYYAELWLACRKSKNLWLALKILFGRPEHLDPSLRAVLETKLLAGPTKPVNRSVKFRTYLTLQIVSVAIVIFFFTLFFNDFDRIEKSFVIILVLATLINCGALLEQQRWIYYLEVARLCLILLFISYEANSLALLFFLIMLIPAIAISESLEKWYYDSLLETSDEVEH